MPSLAQVWLRYNAISFPLQSQARCLARRYDAVWDLLHSVRASGAPGAAPRWDPVYELLDAVSAAADWGLPAEGPVAALLRVDPSGWEPPRCDAVQHWAQGVRQGAG